MNHTLTSQEIARVFAMYYGCDARARHIATGITRKVVGVDGSMVYLTNYLYEGNKAFDQVQLLLSPLSAISDKDAIEVVKIYLPHAKCRLSRKEGNTHVFVNDWGTELYLYSDLSFSYGDTESDYFKKDLVFQHLIQRGYAVPLFFSPGHPCNGKDAIQLGIAIDKTKEAAL